MINDIRDNLFMQRALTILRKFRHRFIEFAKDLGCAFKSSLLESDALDVHSFSILFARALLTLFYCARARAMPRDDSQNCGPIDLQGRNSPSLAPSARKVNF